MTSLLLHRKHYKFIPNFVIATGETLFTRLEWEPKTVCAEDLLDYVHKQFNKNGRSRVSFKKTISGSILTEPYLNLRRNCWYQIYAVIPGLKEQTLFYIGLNEGNQNSTEHRVKMFFRGASDKLYAMETHSAGNKMKRILDNHCLSIDSPGVEFYVEICQIPDNADMHGVAPREIESALIKEQIVLGNTLLLNCRF